MERYLCRNGVRIVLEDIPTVRSVSIGIWIKAGSRNENKENNGISHFIEHMFFKGTKTRTAKEIAECFDSIGGQVNAFTSKECTCYYAKVLDTHASYTLDVLADMFFNSLFLPEEIAKEKNVVLEEIKMYEDTPDDLVHDLLGKAAYGEQELAYSVLGTEDALMKLTQADLKQYVATKYHPKEVVISIAGNVKATFINEVEAVFGAFSCSEEVPTVADSAFQCGHVSKLKETEQAHLLLGYEGLPLGDKQVFPLMILNNILGGSMSSRLFQNVREQRGLAYSIYSYYTPFVNTGVVAIYGGTSANQVKQLYDTVQETLTQLSSIGISDKELTNAKDQLKGNLLLSLESTSSRMTRNGKNELMLRELRSLDDMINLIDEVTLQNVNLIAKQIFSENHATAIIAPEDIKL